MKSRGIIFSAPMVKAILENRKFVTRLYILALMIVIVFWLTLIQVDSGRITDHPDPVVPEAIKQAMQRCGPNYSYRILEGGALQINRDGSWERLRY